MKSKNDQFIKRTDVNNLRKAYPNDLVKKEAEEAKTETVRHKSYLKEAEYFRDQWEGYREIM